MPTDFFSSPKRVVPGIKSRRIRTFHVSPMRGQGGFDRTGGKSLFCFSFIMMLYDEQGVYFLTAKGKAFYAQLMEQGYIALSATKDKISISLRGKIKNIGSEKLDEVFEKNTYMQSIDPTVIYPGRGEN